jgi:hypothetical protein
MKQIAIAAILGVVVVIAASCGGSDDNSVSEQAALVEPGKQNSEPPRSFARVIDR